MKPLHPTIINLLTRAPACRTEPPEGFEWVPAPFRVVLPYYHKDQERALNLLTWIQELDPKLPQYELVVVTDSNTAAPVHSQVMSLGQSVFGAVHEVFVQPSKVPWPGCNNWVFAQAAKHLATMQPPRPWLWLETDMVPTRPGWLDVLSNEYNTARKPFMGPWVEYYDIFNGAAIYPSNVIEWSPKFFAQDVTKALPFDCAIAPDIVWFGHNASHLMPHIWCNRSNGRPGGFMSDPPTWTPRVIDWVINHNAVLAHRCKTGALIQALRERKITLNC